MATDRQDEPETIYITKGLRASAFLSNLIVSLILFCVLGGLVFSYRNPENPLYEHSTFWATIAAAFAFMFSAFFLWPKHDRQRNAITFTENSLHFRCDMQLVEVALQSGLQVIIKKEGNWFSLNFIDAGSGDIGESKKVLVIGGRGDSDWGGVDRLIRKLQPHLVLNWELFQLLSIARLDGKPLSSETELTKVALGEILFAGNPIQRSVLQNRRLSRIIFWAFLLCGFIVGAVTQDLTKGLLATILGSSVSLLFTVAVELYRQKNIGENGPVLLGTGGIGFGEKAFPSTVIPYDAIISLDLRTLGSEDKRWAEVSGRTQIGRQLRVELEIESDDHLAQLEQAIQAAQPKLGTPLAKEKRQ